MEPLTPDTLQGTWSTLLLPLDDSENIRWDGIESQLDALARAQIDGIYFNGTAGEFFSQTDEEFIRLATMVA
ncbi:MAG TPA: dihydrodipicolinate synthase family protein, partial [Opitutae bacterium]|nr:dihydrodipicolinate synthase family protein [Opitutae bacterium]